MKKFITRVFLLSLCILFLVSCKPINKAKNVKTETSNYIEIIEEQDRSTDYVPIPKELSLQYKAEMEQIMLDELPNVIKNADQSVIDAKRLRDKILKNGFDESEAYNLQLILEIDLQSSSLVLYTKMMQVTQEKYLKTPYTPIGTDHPSAIYYYLYPYLKENNVSYDTLYKMDDYIKKQDITIQKYINEVNKLNVR